MRASSAPVWFAFGVCVALAGACSGALSSGGNDGGSSSGADSSAETASGSGSSSGVSSGSSSGSSSSSGGEASASGAALTVDAAISPGTVAGMVASPGNVFVQLAITLQNVGAAAPLPTNPALFLLQTAQGMSASASSAQPTDECKPTGRVTMGAPAQCSLAFEIPAGETPTTLQYDDRRGDAASATVPPVPMPTPDCLTVQTWMSFKPVTTCLGCIGDAIGLGDSGPGPCVSQARAYDVSCASCAKMCGFGSGVFVDMCSCELGCDMAACQNLWNEEMTCISRSCAPACP
jgi:hypothetical protein